MNWTVEFTSKAAKQRGNLPYKIRALLDLLSKEIEISGPIRRNWKNFSRLTDDNFHCHLKKGRPTYVACWRVVDKKIQIIEVYYAGTHENAPY
ncbi:MAG: cytotoxic translational repressor of toxin-antitoxin stability system [Chlamydiae bacterium]|nr:cytotoxic translational repressor of toxin-antitoxin stability system [Chlamydiota bacterium]